MKKIFNNKGSTLVLLIMAIAVISLLGTSILGVTMMNLKIKKTNTALKQTFYLSESGLDQSYAKAYELIQEAVKLANEEAKSFIDEFKPENIEFLSNNYPHNDPYSSCLIPIKETGDDGIEHIVGYSFDEEKIKLEAEKKFKTYYKEYLVTPNYKGKGNDDIVTKLDGTYDNLTVDITYDTPLAFNGDELLLAIDSKYTKNNIQKTTAVKLAIDVPKYDEPYKVLTKVIPVNPFWTKVLTAENVYFKDGKSITFDGDVYVNKTMSLKDANTVAVFNNNLVVNGEPNDSDDIDGGIKLEGSNSRITSKDVCAKNILLNGDRTSFVSADSSNAIYVKDDLEINSANQNVNIDGSYYGFSYGQSGPDTSSGVIINEPLGLNMKVGNDLYLQGSSYANFNSIKYQTGESVSVKGNYRAYMAALTNSTTVNDDVDGDGIIDKYGNNLIIDNITPAYYDYAYLPKSFVDTGEDLDVFDKAYYFYFYNKEYESDGLITPNIEVGNSYTVGTAFSNGILRMPNYSYTIEAKFREAERKYKLESLRLGDDTVAEKIRVGSEEEDNILKFNGEVSFDELLQIKDKYKDSTLAFIENTKSYSNISDGNKELVITTKDVVLTGPFNFKGLIICGGNVLINGNVNFTGAIICGGNITINGSGFNTLTYNQNIVSRIIADYDLHKTIFNPNTSKKILKVTSYVTGSDEGDDVVNVDFSNLLKFNDWKIK